MQKLQLWTDLPDAPSMVPNAMDRNATSKIPAIVME